MSYGINSNAVIGHEVSLYINTALLVIAIPSMIALISHVPHHPIVDVAEGVVEELETNHVGTRDKSRE